MACLSGYASLRVVEDDAHLRELLHAAAQRTGRYLTVDMAADGQEALECIFKVIKTGERHLPNFVLSDLSMPRVDGLQLIRELKRHEATRRIPVAIITSSNQPNDREEANAAGCCAFFNKPIGLDAMESLIGALPDICGDRSRVSAQPA